MEVAISGAEKAQIEGWALLVDGVEVQTGKGRHPSILRHTFKEFPTKDPVVELVVNIGLDKIEAQSTLIIPAILKQRRLGRPVARLVVIPAVADSAGASLVRFDASQSFVTRGGSVSAWEINFGDGTQESGTGQPPSALVHKYVNTTSDRLIFLVALTVYSAPEGSDVLSSFPATLMAGVDPPPLTSANGLALKFSSTDGLGTAVFTTIDLSTIPTDAETIERLSGVRWLLTADGKQIESGVGPTPERIAHLFGSVSERQRIALELVVEMPDGSKRVASLVVELIPTDGPVSPPLIQPEPVKTASRRDETEGDPVL
jgi:hypothetical protein